MAQSPEQKSPKPSKIKQEAGGRRRLLDIALILLVAMLVGIGAWAIASANETAALSTVAEEQAPAKDESKDKSKDKDESKSKDKDAKAKKASSKKDKKKDTSAGKDGESSKVDEGAESEGDEEQVEYEAEDEEYSDPADEDAEEEQYGSEQSSSEDYGSDPSSSYDVDDDYSSPGYSEPSPTYEPEPAQEPSTITVEVTVDGTPANGGYWSTSVILDPGATVYDALLASGAGVNARNTVYGMYVAAIDGLAEKDYGSMSGWVYAVNGVEPPTACSNYRLSDGDSVVWTYVNVEW